jgi:hypothetical protein
LTQHRNGPSDTDVAIEAPAMRAHASAHPHVHLQSASVWLVVGLCALTACSTRAPVHEAPAPGASAPGSSATSIVPNVTRGEFSVSASKLDTWNAIGQIVVRTPGVEYNGRSQMLDLYTVRYRGQPILLIARALLLSDTVRNTTTLVTARTPTGKPIDSDASAELLARLQRELPAEIVRVRATQAAEAAARKGKLKKPKSKSARKK